jgi:F0F1-type ATP synthase assembly protein I
VKRPEDETAKGMGEGSAVFTIAITFALTVTGLLLLGYWLDGQLGTSPLLLVAGCLVGTGLGGFWAYQRVKRLK